MPTFSAITVERVVESNEKTKAKLKKKSLTDGNGAPLRFGSPALYTTPKSTPIPYISRSFTASPYVINHKRRGPPPPPVVVEKVEVNDAPCQNGFLLGDRDQESDTQKGITENKIASDEIGINNEEIIKTQSRNNEIGAKSDNEKNINNTEKRKNEDLSVREESGVAEKMKSVLIQEKGVNQELNVKIRRIGIRGDEEVLTQQKYNKNKVNGDKIRADEGTRIREENDFKERNNESEVNSNENMVDKEIRIREENGATEKSILQEEMVVNQDFGVQIRKIETSGLKGMLKGIRVKCDHVDIELESPDEGRLKLDSHLRDFSPKGMMEGSVVSNDQDNVAMALNMRREFPISGLNKVKTIYGQTECCCVAENEIYSKSNGDEVLRSAGDIDYTPRTNRSDFFDAEEDLSPEDDLVQSSRSYNSRTHAELEILRSKISTEIARRIRAEEALSLLQNLWQEMIEKFSLIGVSLPSIEIDGNRMAIFVEDVSGQFFIARTVANAVGRASIRAESEHEMKVQIDNKNTEISRLRDKLQYYELVNHEMSQRNQETIELARRRRRRLKKRQRWLWSSFAISIAIGATAVSLRHKFRYYELK